ncbi:T9SS type B sorting domain-containing protein [Labilibaculum euxinus]
MKKLYILILAVCISYLSYGQNADFCIGDVDLFVGESLCLQGSLFDKSDAMFKLEAELCFRNAIENELLLLSGSDISLGSFCFKGSADSYLKLADADCLSLELNMSDSDLFLSGELTLTDRLSLFAGRVLADGDGQVNLNNSSESSLIFNNVKNNASYLGVKLSRAVFEGGEYVYPVGDESSYHPFVISYLSADANVSVTYSTNYDEMWSDVTNNYNYEFSFSGAWQVDDDGVGVNFTPQLSKLTADGKVVDDNLAVFYVADPWDPLGRPVVDYSPVHTSEYMLGLSKKNFSGLYSLVKSDYGLSPEGDDIYLVNAIVANQNSPSYLIVPDLDRYQRVSMEVYDSWGRLVFVNKEYSNDFNCRDFPSGTYYYHLQALLKNGVEIIKDDMVEVIRQNY